MTIGGTGHQTLSEHTRRQVEAALRAELDRPVVGVTSLAAGADQLFAQAVLDAGGSLVYVVPSAGYASSLEDDEDRARLHRLAEQAIERVELPFDAPCEEAYWAAGRAVVDRSERLLAVWDGAPAAGLGGTADVVEYARETGKPVTVIWPPGAGRGSGC